MRNPTAAALAIAAVSLAVPPAAAAEATLGVDPVAPCYREQSVVHLPGAGFTPNGAVVFTRDGTPLGDPVVADGGGQLCPAADPARSGRPASGGSPIWPPTRPIRRSRPRSACS